MMRVGLFIDGKNFYRGYKQAAADRLLDFSAMAHWLVDEVGGDVLWGAYYYTTVGNGESWEDDGVGQSLARFLDMLECQQGFFVQRIARRPRTVRCSHCQTLNRVGDGGLIDTTMVADILTFAASDAFDVAVLVSGEPEHAPALAGVRALGKQTYVAQWGENSAPTALRRVSFDSIDLLEGVKEFSKPYASRSDDFETDRDEDGRRIEGLLSQQDEEEVFLVELERAEHRFQEGYVGVNYFLTRWHGDALPESPEIRRIILDRLVEQGRVEIYAAPDGAQAVRIVADPESPEDEEDME